MVVPLPPSNHKFIYFRFQTNIIPYAHHRSPERYPVLSLIIIVFILGYLAIAFEHQLHINKAASALFVGVLCWALYALNFNELLPESSVPDWFRQEAAHEEGDIRLHFLMEHQLVHIVSEISFILFFLMGAMTIVELVDAHEGFAIITARIHARSHTTLLCLICGIAFVLSAILDNLTTTIVMISVLRKLVHQREARLVFAGMIVIAANAGGAWSVIGDVTTTMLWIKGKIGTVEVVQALLLPSIVCLAVPLAIAGYRMRGDRLEAPPKAEHLNKNIQPWHQYLFLSLGLLALLSVPIFKAYTHLPPFMGMLMAMSGLWFVSELVGHTLDETTRSSTGVLSVLKRIDMPSILFFLGILLAVGCLSATGILRELALWLDQVTGGRLEIVAVLIGLLSAIVDNVPLVAAGIEMYHHELNHPFWMMLAYCAGTGGSCLIIGSAAGVAAMGLERISFLWYLRKIAPLALFGYLAGFAVYLLQAALF